MVSLVPALIGGVASLLGVLLLYAGVRKYRRTRRRRSMDPTPVADLRPDRGLVEVEGSARPATTATLDAESVEEDALVRYRVVEFHGGDDGSGWYVEESELETVPLEVNDGTGSVRVALPEFGVANGQPTQFLDGAGIGDPNLSLEPVAFDGRDDEWPTRLGVSGEDIEENRARFREGAIGVGETVYVAGVPERSAGGVEVGTGDSPGEFVLADRPEAEFESDEKFGPVVLLGLGVVLALFGGAFLVAGLGLLG